MPTVYREAGFKFRIYPQDHGPPHLHVWKAGGVVKIRIGDENMPPTPLDPGRMAGIDVRRAVRIVERKQEILAQEWDRYCG